MNRLTRTAAALTIAATVLLAASPAHATSASPATGCSATLVVTDHSVIADTNGDCAGYMLTMHTLPGQKIVGESPTGPLAEPCGPFQVDFSKGTYPDWSFIAGFVGDNKCPPPTTTTSTTVAPTTTTTEPATTTTLVHHKQPPPPLLSTTTLRPVVTTVPSSTSAALASTGTPSALGSVAALGLGMIAAGGLLLIRRRRP
jgi:LPXTG-motif cell wall-anchored protein